MKLVRWKSKLRIREPQQAIWNSAIVGIMSAIMRLPEFLKILVVKTLNC